MSRAGLCLAAALMGSAGFATADNDKPNRGKPKHEQATGHDFKGEKVSKLGSLNADLNCEKLYDSADPISMLVELGSIVGPAVLLGKMPEISGYSEAERKKLYSDLRTLAKQKVWLPVTLENELGDLLHDTYVKDQKAIDPENLNKADRKRYDRVKVILDGILKGLPEDNTFKFRLGVIASDDFNATVNPGGYIYVNQGLLRDAKLKDDELAVILAHEVAHVTKRHALKEWQIKLVDAMELGKNLKALLQLKSNPKEAIGAMIGTIGTGKALFQRFDHTQEFEGDACGVQLGWQSKEANIENGVNQYAKRYSGRGRPTKKSWGESHPSSDERIQMMHRQVARMKSGTKIVLSDEERGSSAPAEPTGGSEGGVMKTVRGWFGRGGNAAESSEKPSALATEKPAKQSEVAATSETKSTEGGVMSTMKGWFSNLPSSSDSTDKPQPSAFSEPGSLF